MLFQPLTELHIFHKRNIQIPAAAEVKFPFDEQGMITRRNTRQAAALVHKPGDDPKNPVRVRKPHPKTAPKSFRPDERLGNHFRCAGGQMRVCMEKQKYIVFAVARTTAQLMTT